MCHHHAHRERVSPTEPIETAEEEPAEALEEETEPSLETEDGRVFVPPADD